MKNKIFVLLSFILSACSIQPISLTDKVDDRYNAPYRIVLVDNLSAPGKVSVAETIYVNGWVPIHNGFEPPLNDSFVVKVKKAITASGDSGRLDISVMRVGFFVEKSVGDDIAFVGLFMVGRDRGFKCDADVNIKTENDSKRVTMLYETRRPYFDNNEQIRQFVETCHSDLIRQIARAVTPNA